MKAPDHRGGPAQGRVLPGCTGAVQCKFSDGDQRPGDGQLPAFGAAGSGTPQGGDPQRGSGGPGGGDHELLEDKFHSVRGGKGICFAVPLSSVIGVNLYQFLSDNRMGREG